MADGKKMTISETTNYPFDETISFTIDRGKARFPFYLRIPRWTRGATVSVNGEPVSVRPVSGKYLVIDREWKKGKTNRTRPKAIFRFLVGCTKAQANFWRNLKRFFGENHEAKLALTN